jgi:hypothetical protein
VKDSITLSIPKKDLARKPTMVREFTNFVEHCKWMDVAAMKRDKPQLMRNIVDLVDTHTSYYKMQVLVMEPSMCV